MDTIFAKVAGLDVHQKFITVGIRCRLETGKLFAEVRTFGTMTRDLMALADYLEALGVTHVAMESTGVLWKPVWNILESRRFTLFLVNPRHVKQVPGRKSDVSDAEWIAQLLQCGLLQSSFVPKRELRELRDLTRYRAQLVSEQTRVANRIHKILEDANIKLGAVASDILGKSGRAMLGALVGGQQDPEKLADLAEGRLRAKIPDLKLALEGHFSEHIVVPGTPYLILGVRYGVPGTTYGVPGTTRLTAEQAMYHFVSGYTSKVAGTEKGVTEPQVTFSPCFSGPFLPLHPRLYGRLLAEKIQKHQARCWLVNTGITGGPYGVGQRIAIKLTRGLITAALEGKLDDVPTRPDPLFRLGAGVVLRHPRQPARPPLFLFRSHTYTPKPSASLSGYPPLSHTLSDQSVQDDSMREQWWFHPIPAA